MAKKSITTLQNRAAKSEQDFREAFDEIIDCSTEDFGEFFGKLNIPRTLKANPENGLPDPDLSCLCGDYQPEVSDFDAEVSILSQMAEFHVRHVRKLQWHSSHAEAEAVPNVRRLYRAVAVAVSIRLSRVSVLLQAKDDLNAMEWSMARMLANRALSDFREATTVVATSYLDDLMSAVAQEQLAEVLAPLVETVGKAVSVVEDKRVGFEMRRQDLSVIPAGYPAVKPAPYFTGDVLEAAAWTRYRTGRQDHLRTLSTVLADADAA